MCGGDQQLLAVDARVSIMYILMQTNRQANLEEKIIEALTSPERKNYTQDARWLPPRQSLMTSAVSKVNIVNPLAKKP